MSKTELDRISVDWLLCPAGYAKAIGCEDGATGSVTLLYKGKILAYRTLQKGETAVMITDGKTVHNTPRPARRIALSKHFIDNKNPHGNLHRIIPGEEH